MASCRHLTLLLHLGCVYLFLTVRSEDSTIGNVLEQHREGSIEGDTLHRSDGDTLSQHHREKKSVIDDSLKQHIVQTLNNQRRSVKASDMIYAKWDNLLANYANDVASSCNIKPGPDRFPTGVTSSKYLQRIFGYSSSYSGKTSFSEMLTSSSIKDEITSSESDAVGCAENYCTTLFYGSLTERTNVHYLLCILPKNLTYNSYNRIGDPCSGCSSWGRSYWCNIGLCRDDCDDSISCDKCLANCKVCKYVLSSSCSCLCAYESHGVQCDASASAFRNLTTCTSGGSTIRTDFGSTNLVWIGISLIIAIQASTMNILNNN